MSDTNTGWLDGLKGLLSDVGDAAKDAIGTYKDIDDVLNPSGPTPAATQQAAPTPPYNPNMTWGDFAFTPNYVLLLGGAALLIVALVLKKKG